MKIEARRIVELLGTLTVVLSLVFVGYELRQSNDIAMRDARDSISDKKNEISRLALENHSHRTLLIKMSSSNAELTTEESLAASHLIRLYLSYWASVQAAQDGGFLPDYVYEMYLQAAKDTLRTTPYLAIVLENRFNVLGIDSGIGGIYGAIIEEIAAHE